MTLTTVAAEELADGISKCNHSPICSVCRERLAELTDRAALRDEAFDVVVRANRVAELEARLAETRKALELTVKMGKFVPEVVLVAAEDALAALTTHHTADG